MDRFEAIKKAYETAHGVKIGATRTRFYYIGGSFLDMHVKGEALNVWHSYNLETNEEAGTYTPDEYYLRAREIADDIVNEVMTWYDFSAVDSADEFEDALRDAYDDTINEVTAEESEEEARAHVMAGRDHIEHAMCEADISDSEMLDYMFSEDGFRSLDRLGLYDYNVEAVSNSIEEAREEIEKLISDAHFIPEI